MIISCRHLATCLLLLSSATLALADGQTSSDESGGTCTGYTVVCGDRESTVGNGCRKDNNKDNPRVPTLEVTPEQKHEVRCCSDVQPPGIDGWVKRTGCAAWGFSKCTKSPAPGVSDGCHWRRNYTEAVAICANNGGRLCTVEELLSKCTVGSACNFDHHHVWAKATAPTVTGASYSPDYLGCYADFNTQHLSFKVGSPYSVDSCALACETAQYSLYGVKSGDTCYCGHTNNENSMIAESECSSTPLIGNGKCGGPRAVSVYNTRLQASPQDFYYEDKYRSCVKDTDSHFEYKLAGSFGIKDCYEACGNAGFPLAALAEGSKCWCGNEEPLEQSTDCKLPCTSGKGICGGSAVSRAVSMYRTPVSTPTIKSLGLCKGQLSNFWGDPHMVTFDNFKYNCQGIGHFTLTECKDYKLQAIFKQATATATSVTHGVAAQYKSYPTVQVIINNQTGPLSVPFETNKCFAELYIGGQLYNTSTASFAQLKATSGIDISMDLKGFTVSFPQPGPSFIAKIRAGQGCLLDVDTCLHQECIGSSTYPVVGLLGTPNGNNKDEWMNRNGTIYTGGTDATKYCNSVWCIKQMSESIFTYPPGTSFSTFDRCSNNPPSPPPQPPINLTTVPPPILDACLHVAMDHVDEANCLMDILPDVNNTPRATGNVKDALENTVAVTPDVKDIPVPPIPQNNCTNEVMLYNTNGVTPLAEIGSLHFVGRSATDGTVTLQWYNVHGVNPARLYIEYENATFAYLCGNTTAPFQVACPPQQMSTMVQVTVSDVDSLKPGDKASPHECCHGSADLNPKVRYTFVVPCKDPCPEEEAEERVRYLRARV